MSNERELNGRFGAQWRFRLELRGATAIYFGGVPTSFTVISDAEITATAPAGQGTVDITVSNGDQTSAVSATDRFTYAAVAGPTVSGISPTMGATAGNTLVTVTGSGFSTAQDGTLVYFGASPAAGGVSCSSSTACTAVVGPSAGTVDVTATVTLSGMPVTSPTSQYDQFTYVPAITQVTTSSGPLGPAGGGTTVTILGSGFSTAPGATSIKFGTAPATNVSCTNGTTCYATSPPGSGVVDVAAVTTVGSMQVTSATNSSDQFSYIPSITSMTPTTGSTAGGPEIMLTGAGFTSVYGPTSITVGSTVAAQVVCPDSAHCSTTIPPGSGPVSVLLTTSPASPRPVGTSVTLTAASTGCGAPAQYQFSFTQPGSTTPIVLQDWSAGATSTWDAPPPSCFETCSPPPVDSGLPPGRYTLAVAVRATGLPGPDQSKQLSYSLAPTVTAVSPASGGLPGGTVVTITGTGFATAPGATGVKVGTAAATSVSCSSGTSCTATSPAGSAGQVDVTVTVAGVTSATSPADHFSYVRPCTAVSLSASPQSPQFHGVTITATGSATGCGATAEYRFAVVSGSDTPSWSAWSSSATASWNTAGACVTSCTSAWPPGTYTLMVQARVGGTAGPDTSNQLSDTLL